MWNRVTLRMKITLLTAMALSVLAAALTGLSIYNARQITFLPQGTLTVMHYMSAWDPENLARPPSAFRMVDHSAAHIVIHTDAPQNMGNVVSFQNEVRFIPSEALQLQEISGWHIRGQDAFAELSQSQQNFQTHSILIAVLAVLFGTFAAYIISGQALKPIKSLAEKIEVVDANNLNQPIEPSKTIDEVSRLTHSFNSMLEKLNHSFEAQKLFAQNAAHELKTPLASMRANIEVLQMDENPSVEEYREVMGVVKDNTERLIALVEGLLSFNNGTSNKSQIFNGREVFEGILQELGEDIAQKQLNASIEGDCQIRGDKPLLERAFFNLIHNAVRYNGTGGMIKIGLFPDHITIEDSGPGIPPEHLAHIFEPFYCIDQSRSKHLGGHGLGMAIAKHIFDKHQMEIQVFSERGLGTELVVSLRK